MNPLSQLRDIHFPFWLGIWPIAFGWYIVFFLLIFTLFLAIYLKKCRDHRLISRREAIRKLQTLKSRYDSDADLVAVARELSILLRRAALAKFSHEEVAGLHDEHWLAFLNQSGRTTQFTDGVGKILISAPYQRNANFIADDLFTLVDNWIRINLDGAKSKK